MPRLDDDRMPIVLVTLDGVGDRQIPELGGRTPSEAATTPVLDELARRGSSGWHLPFGWGRAPASELAHWAMFGFGDVPFPGRAVLEALGAGLDIECETAVTYATLRTSRIIDGKVWITGRVGQDDAQEAAALFRQLGPLVLRHKMTVRPLQAAGEMLLTLEEHRNAEITDSDPFFEDFHPWLRVLPATSAAQPTARALTEFLLNARDELSSSPINEARRARGVPALDVLTTKWSGARTPIPTFAALTGVAGAAVTSTRLYRGLATILNMTQSHLSPISDIAADMDQRLSIAEDMISKGARFVHVHTKATDEAGHSKQPRAKLEVLNALDPGLERLINLADRAIVAVTGDHATPSVDGVLHTADPTPLVIAGPTVRSDSVTEFGEWPAHAGWFGTLRAAELLPLLFGFANRPTFLGHRPTPVNCLALPDYPEPMMTNHAYDALADTKQQLED